MARTSIWSPLRTPAYRRLWLGQTVSVVGDKVNQIAMGVMVYERTRSLLQMGVMLAVTVLPAALFAMVAGAYVDRWHRGRTMLVADLLRAGLVLLVPFAVDHGIGWAYAIAFLVATVSLFFEPAKLSLVPDLVDGEALMAANSLDSASVAGAELFGLALGGVLVAALTYAGAFMFDACTYLVSALFIATLMSQAGRAPREAGPLSGLFSDVREGAAYISRTPVLRDLMLVYSVAVVGGAGSMTLCYLLALKTFAQPGLDGAVRLAMLDTSITAGLLVGSILIGRTGSGRAGAKFLSGLVAFGALFAAVALLRSIWAAMAVLLLVGVANMWFQVPMYTMLQQHTRESLRGRVFAARTTVIRIFTVAGLVGAGAAAERLGIPLVVAAVGLLVLVAGVLGWSRPSLRDA